MKKSWLSRTQNGFRLAVQISPNGKKNEVIAILDDAVRIRLQAPPVDGKANEALVRYLADKVGVTKSQVNITHGFTSRRKLVDITLSDVSLEDIEKRFSPGDVAAGKR